MQGYTDEHAHTSWHISVVSFAEVRCSQFEATHWLATAADGDQPLPACFEHREFQPECEEAPNVV